MADPRERLLRLVRQAHGDVNFEGEAPTLYGIPGRQPFTYGDVAEALRLDSEVHDEAHHWIERTPTQQAAVIHLHLLHEHAMPAEEIAAWPDLVDLHARQHQRGEAQRQHPAGARIEVRGDTRYVDIERPTCILTADGRLLPLPQWDVAVAMCRLIEQAVRDHNERVMRGFPPSPLPGYGQAEKAIKELGGRIEMLLALEAKR